MKRNVASSIVALASAAGLVGCTASSAPETASFVLYHNSVTDENMRIHVATFDATDGGEAYNRSNCDQAQPGVKTKFWCEKGRIAATR